jgi:uncharacterized protein with ParB-like and HNH nuclease domain
MVENSLRNPRLKSIAEFLDGKHHFFIPSYQRGYRWEERQIIDLLTDILGFQDEIKKKRKETDVSGEFYCLQPIVVLDKGNNNYEVIDGQQRLTTIYILLSYLKPKLSDFGYSSDLFSIRYETREKEKCSSKEFLENIITISNINKTNIDFYRMSDAYLIIKDWFEKEKPVLGKFCDTLLSTEYNEDNVDESNNVRFIWYELNPDGDKPNIAFSKYNQGKIDLTNAELIKAIFYLSDNYRDKKEYQLKIGYEWDDMEKTLRTDDFWGFINPQKSYVNHIEFIFELVANKYLDKVDLKLNKNIDTLWSFYVFNELITKNIKIYDEKYKNTRDFLWDEVKTYYRTFVEWYNDNTYYHIIVFLLQIGEKIKDIKELTERNSKTDLEKELMQLIRGHFEELDLDQLGFYDDKIKAKELLLLFNVITTMNSQYNRFPFHIYKNGNWSLEHIHAQQSEELNADNQKKLLLNEQKQYFFKHDKKELFSKINNLLEMAKIDPEKFNAVQKEIFDEYSDTTSIHSIKNLALLEVSDNSCLNNNIFPIKRNLIKELDENGSFIPICTKNVFLKYYSKGVEQNVRWDEQDMKSYLKEMKKVLNNYIRVKDHEH